MKGALPGRGDRPGRAVQPSRPPASVGRVRPWLPCRPGRAGVDARRGRLGQDRRGLQQSGSLLPGVRCGPFGGFCRLRFLAQPCHFLFGGLPPLHRQCPCRPQTGQSPSPCAVVLERGGQKFGQRSRPASGGAGDGLQPGCGLPERGR